MLQRVDALATVHRRLYQSEDIARFDVAAFAVNLVTDVVGASGRDNIEVRTDTDTIQIKSADAAALGLVLNEVVTNAIKHAYPDGRAGILLVEAKRVDGEAAISIVDDGPGMKIDGTQPSGLGRTLITRLSKQFGGTTEWLAGPAGTRVTITFPIDN